MRALRARRAHDCRLTPDHALHSLDEADAFLRDRGLLTRTPDCALPSLYEACHEDPYRPGVGGFGEWPATKWPWAGVLAGRPGVVAAKIHRGKTILLDPTTAALADPICRAEIDRMRRADPGWDRLLGHLADAGPSTAEDLRVELGLNAPELKALRSPLERCGALVTRWAGAEEGGAVEAFEVARWDQLVPAAGGEPELAALLVAGVRAAVVAPERELGRWFSWTWRFEPGVVDRLVAEDRLVRPEPGWVAAGTVSA